MTFNSKQLEELENIHDSTGAFEEEADDESGFDDVGEAAMDWRRGLIEEATEGVKRAKTRPVDSAITYNIGSMLFDRDVRRFARVQRSVPGFLKIVYISGGDREYGTLDVQGYLREFGAQKRLSELCEQLGMNDVDVLIELERMGITPIEDPDVVEIAVVDATPVLPPIPKPARELRPSKAVLAELDEPDEDEVSADDDVDPPALDDDIVITKAGKGKASKAAAPIAAKASSKALPLPAAAKPAVKPSKSAGPVFANTKKPAPAALTPSKNVKKAAPPPAPATAAPASKKAGKGVNPIDDPNGYIKAHYQEMSNRELARVTGLSEHTIRRKLGEWSMKRKKD